MSADTTAMMLKMGAGAGWLSAYFPPPCSKWARGPSGAADIPAGGRFSAFPGRVFMPP